MERLLLPRLQGYREGEDSKRKTDQWGFSVMSAFTGAQHALCVREYYRYNDFAPEDSRKYTEREPRSNNPNESELGVEVRVNGFNISPSTSWSIQDNE